MSTKLYVIGVIAFIVFMAEPGCMESLVKDGWLPPSMIGQRIGPQHGVAAQAGGDSSDAVDSLREVQALNDKAMSKDNLSRTGSMSFSEIDAAIDKMPGQASLYTDRAAMLISVGKSTDARESRARALGIHYVASPDPVPGDPDPTTVAGEGAWNYRNDYVKSLTRVRAQLADGDRQKVVGREICEQYRAQPTFRDKAGVEQKLPVPADLKCP